MKPRTICISLAFLMPLLFTVPLSAQSLTILTEQMEPAQNQRSDGSVSGFALELVQEIQRRLGNKDQIRFVVWENGYSMALKEKNTVLFTTNRTLARMNLFQWVGPVFETVNALYTWKSNNLAVSTLDDARKLPTIGVYTGDLWDQKLTGLGFTNLDRAPTDELKFKKFIEGRYDVISSGSLTMGPSLATMGKTLQDVKVLVELSRTQGFLAFSKSTDPSIVSQWRSTLEQIRADGTMGKIYNRYQVDLPGPPEDPLF